MSATITNTIHTHSARSVDATCTITVRPVKAGYRGEYEVLWFPVDPVLRHQFAVGSGIVYPSPGRAFARTRNAAEIYVGRLRLNRLTDRQLERIEQLRDEVQQLTFSQSSGGNPMATVADKPKSSKAKRKRPTKKKAPPEASPVEYSAQIVAVDEDRSPAGRLIVHTRPGKELFSSKWVIALAAFQGAESQWTEDTDDELSHRSAMENALNEAYSWIDGRLGVSTDPAEQDALGELATAIDQADEDELFAELLASKPDDPSPPPEPNNQTNGQANNQLASLKIELLDQHPDNPDPSEAELVEQMAWMQSGQDEPITVRPRGKRYEVLAGKRRSLAAGRLGWETIEARVRTDLADDAAAVRYLFASNAQRHEDNPMRRAQGLAAMIASGMDPLAAGQVFGISSRGGVDNALGLLKLPQVWQERVVSGEMPETCAYALKPYVDHAPLMKAFDKAYRGHGWQGERMRSKESVREALRFIVKQNARPIDKGVKHNYGYQLHHDHQRYFRLTPELEAKLQIVKLPLGKNGKQQQYALNVKAYDKLQIPLIKDKIAQRNSGGSKGAKKQTAAKLSPKEKAAEEKRKRKEADSKLADWIKHEWRPAMLRLLASRAVLKLSSGEQWRADFLLPRLIESIGRDAPLYQFECVAADHFQEEPHRKWNEPSDAPRLIETFAGVDLDEDPISQLEERRRRYVALLLWPQEPELDDDDKHKHITAIGPQIPFGGRMPQLSIAAVDWIAKFLEGVTDERVNMKGGWESAVRQGPAREMLQLLLNRMNRAQLCDLASEIVGRGNQAPGVSYVKWVTGFKKKSEVVESLLSLHNVTPLKLPKVLI